MDKNTNNDNVSIQQIIFKLEQKARQEIDSDDSDTLELTLIPPLFESMCNSILLFFEGVLNLLSILFLKTKIGKKILKTFVHLVMSYGYFGILSMFYLQKKTQSETTSFLSIIKNTRQRGKVILLNFNDKISVLYQPFLQQEYDSLV